MPENNKQYAVWAITPNGARQGEKIASALPESDLWVSHPPDGFSVPFKAFNRLSEILSQVFNRYQGHIFIMSTSIVVRMIGPLIRHNTHDPAIVVMDEMGLHAISLISGDMGRADALAKQAAEAAGATPVITSAVEVNPLPMIDVIAKQRGIYIENPPAAKHVSLAILTRGKIRLHDPFGLIRDTLPAWVLDETPADKNAPLEGDHPLYPPPKGTYHDLPGIFVDDVEIHLSCRILILRPPSLFAGIRCSRNGNMTEMWDLLYESFRRFHLSPGSLAGIATAEIKDEAPGLTALAASLKLPVLFFDKEALKGVKGIQNECEAAAILGAGNGKLIMPGQSSQHVTLAVARKNFV